MTVYSALYDSLLIITLEISSLITLLPCYDTNGSHCLWF